MAIVKSVQDRHEWLIATSGALDWSSSGGGARLGNDVPTAGGLDDEKILGCPIGGEWPDEMFENDSDEYETYDEAEGSEDDYYHDDGEDVD